MQFAYKYIAGVVRYCNCYGIELPQGMESSLSCCCCCYYDSSCAAATFGDRSLMH